MENHSITDEDIIDPELPIIDCHHHLWLKPARYLLDEFSADLKSGHNIHSTVYVECNAMYRQHGPEHKKPIGEAEFVAGMAAISEAGHYGKTQICAAFVGAADLTLGAEVDDVLEALDTASGGRLRGIRGTATWNNNPAINTGIRPYAQQGLLRDPRFRKGVACLAKRNLVYDAWQYHPQLPDFCDLADQFPDMPMVVNHCGGLLGIHAYASPENFGHWKALITDVARRPNTLMKLGGLSARRCGFAFEKRSPPPTSQQLADAWRPYIETCIELFGPERCMFESNFPPDNIAGSYRSVWNALKLTAVNCSAPEKEQMFHKTASRTYRIADVSTKDQLPPRNESHDRPSLII